MRLGSLYALSFVVTLGNSKISSILYLFVFCCLAFVSFSSAQTFAQPPTQTSVTNLFVSGWIQGVLDASVVGSVRLLFVAQVQDWNFQAATAAIYLLDLRRGWVVGFTTHRRPAYNNLEMGPTKPPTVTYLKSACQALLLDLSTCAICS